LFWHLRQQLNFDIWPLALAVFLIACAERGKLMDPNKSNWFTVFRIIFECTSAYSTIGLSLGSPNNNYSFSGEFGTVSKLIVSGLGVTLETKLIMLSGDTGHAAG
jgi:Trk-type K+ transport system membrane component